MKEKIEKLLKLVDEIKTEEALHGYIPEKKEMLESVKLEVSSLLINEIFPKEINEGVKAASLQYVYSVLFKGAKKELKEINGIYLIGEGNEQILFDGKEQVEIDCLMQLVSHRPQLYRFSNFGNNAINISGLWDGISSRSYYDEFGIETSRITSQQLFDESIFVQELSRSKDDVSEILVKIENEKQGMNKSFVVNKINDIYNLDVNYSEAGVSPIHEDADKDFVEYEITKRLEIEEVYKYFPKLKQGILDRLSAKTDEVKTSKQV